MAYENISSVISKGYKKIIFSWMFLSILTIAGVIGYDYLNKNNSALDKQILYFSEINGEAAFLLSQKEKIDPDKTTLNSWITAHKDTLVQVLPNLAPEITLLEKLGLDFYKAVPGEESSSAYQAFYDQLQLLKRVLQTQIDESPINTMRNIGLPVYLGLLLICIFLSINHSQSSSKELVRKNSLILEELWEEIQEAPETPNFAEPLTRSVVEYKQHTSQLMMQSKDLNHSLENVQEALKYYVQHFHLPQANTEDYDLHKEYKEKLLYIQKLLTRLFTRAERASALAKASSDNGFQAGILALNISIEASRNGEHGKPFLSVSDKVKDFAEKSSHIGQAIMEELKDADLAIRKAYAIGKNILEQLPEHGNTESLELPKISILSDSINNLEQLLSVNEKMYQRIADLQNELDQQDLESINPMDIRTAEIMRNTMIRNFERLYRATYGTDPIVISDEDINQEKNNKKEES